MASTKIEGVLVQAPNGHWSFRYDETERIFPDPNLVKVVQTLVDEGWDLVVPSNFGYIYEKKR